MNWLPDENASQINQSALSIPTPFFSNSHFHSIPLNLSQGVKQMYMFENENLQEQKQRDEEFINNFIKIKLSKKVTKRSPAPLKIFEAKKYLIDIILLKIGLEMYSKALDVNSTDFCARWEEIVTKQKKINDLLSIFDDNSLLSLKTSLQKRRKKRIWEKTRKLKKMNRKGEITNYSRSKHALIDKLLAEKGKEVESLKRTEALRRQADSVLHEVRRKKYEAKKIMNILAALSSLRHVRSQQEVAKGGYCSKEISETFKNVINQFQGLWKKQSEVYNLEEKGLKVMLEENEISEMKISNIQKILTQWEQAFFGSPSSDDNYKCLTASDDDINSLILVRRDWDQYISNHSAILSSCIPVGWVSPPQSNDGEWNVFLKSKKRKF